MNTGVAATVLAALSLGLASYALLRKAPVHDVASCDHTALEAEIAQLRSRLILTERQVGNGGSRLDAPPPRSPAIEPTATPATGAGDPAADETPRAPEAATKRATPAYSEFRAPSGVRVHQAENGSLSVENSDPTLTAQIQVVEAVRADGSIDRIALTMPPPGS